VHSYLKEIRPAKNSGLDALIGKGMT